MEARVEKLIEAREKMNEVILPKSERWLQTPYGSLDVTYPGSPVGPEKAVDWLIEKMNKVRDEEKK